MLKKGFTVVILMSIMLHGASRVGLLTYLTHHRHDIAYTIGFIAEIPIAMCNNAYDFNTTFKIDSRSHDEAEQPLIFQTAKIDFFIPLQFNFDSQRMKESVVVVLTHYNLVHYQSPLLDIFRPPCDQA